MRILLNPTRWQIEAAKIINEKIVSILKMAQNCNVMLTGGRSARQLYKVWASLPEFRLLENVHFFLSDERCVSEDHSDSNYGMIMHTLFSNGIPGGCTFAKIFTEGANFHSAAKQYEMNLPDNLDLILLSVGDDGHIASLFPMSAILYDKTIKVSYVKSPLAPYDRITIAPYVLYTAKCIFVLSIGDQKEKLFREALLDPKCFMEIPARLVLDSNWFCLK
jgi:6-phosphogluconolactonase